MQKQQRTFANPVKTSVYHSLYDVLKYDIKLENTIDHERIENQIRNHGFIKATRVG